MEKNISEEELSLRKRARRRLIGAIALVIVAVVILPVVFDEEPKPMQRELAIHIQNESSTNTVLPPLRLVDELTKKNVTQVLAPAAQPTPDPDKLVQIEAVPMETKKEKISVPVPAYKPKQASATVKPYRLGNQPDVASGGFVVQLGAFSDHAKALYQQQHLVSSGIKAYTDKLTIGDVRVMRVRVGPFITREAAEITLEKLKNLGLSGVVTRK